MTPIYHIAIDDLGTAFLDALKTWDQYLKDEKPWGTEVVAAHCLFTDILGARWSPGKSPTDRQMKSLEDLAKMMDLWKVAPNLLTKRLFKTLLKDWQAGIDYVNDNFGATVVVAHSPTPHPASETPIASFAWFIHHTSIHVGDGNPPATGGVGARNDGKVPPGYTVKGNLDSMKYHTPDSPWYKQTIAEVWLADEDSAHRAGFLPV